MKALTEERWRYRREISVPVQR